MEQLEKIAEFLFPTWPTIVSTLIALLILILVLTKLVYKPVKNMYQKRQIYVQSNIDESKKQLIEANLKREKASEELLNARNKAQAIIEEANKIAEQVKIQSVVKAKDEAQNLIKQAKINIDKLKQDLETNSRKIIADVALEMASKVLDKEVDAKVHSQLIKEYLDEKHDS